MKSGRCDPISPGEDSVPAFMHAGILPMTTFDALSHIRRDALTPPQALRFLIEQFGFTVSYAREVLGAVFAEIAAHGPDSAPEADGTRRPSVVA
jgi:hypothetical protein